MSSSADEPFDESLLSAYLDQELAPSERLKVERELDQSPELRTLFAELAQIRNLVATCNIPLASEPKAISGPWDSTTTTTLVSPATLDSSHSARTKNWTRLASLAAAIALLMGLGSIVILSTSTGRWISSNSTNEKVAKRESKPPSTQSASVPSASAPFPADPSVILPPPEAVRSSPAARAPEAIAPATGTMTTDAAVVAANAPRSSSESTSESLASRFTQYVNSDANKTPLKTENSKSLANDQQELTGVFRVQANSSLESESGYLLFFDDAKGGKAETLAFKSPSESLERQLGENRDKSNQELIEKQGAIGLQRKGQVEDKEQVVELIIPEEKWEVASALLVEKGFAIEDMRSNSADASSVETLSFRAAANPTSPTEWTIVPEKNGPLRKEDAKSTLIAEPAQNLGTDASRKASRRSDQDVVESKDTGRKFRRIRVTLSEETTKSRSDE